MPLKSELAIRVTPELTKTIGAYIAAIKPEIQRVLALATGVGAGQADLLYYAKPTIGGSATLTLDLIGGGLVDPFGVALAFVRIKQIVLWNEVGPNTINLQRPASNGLPFLSAAGASIPVHSGGLAALFWPGVTAIPVTAGTGDLVDLVNTAAGNVTPELWIVGASA